MFDTFFETELQKLMKSGSYYTKEELLQLRENLKYKIDRHTGYETIVEDYLEMIFFLSEQFIKTGSIHGLSLGMVIENIDINLQAGKNVTGKPICKNTVFDIASISKLFTLLLAFLLEEQKNLNFNENIQDICPKFIYLKNYTVLDLLMMKGEIRTKGRICDAKDMEEAMELLYTLYVYNADKNTSIYTDMGLIALTKIMEKVVYEKNNSKLSFAEIMEKYLLNPYSLVNTTFFPKEEIAGNGRQDTLVNDPKARKLGGAVGSAGLYSNSYDINKIAKLIFSNSIIHKTHLKWMYTNFYKTAKGIAGLYQKYPDLSKTYVPKEYSDKTFASEGTTGSVAIFDIENKVHNNILVDSFELGEKKKPPTFKRDYNTFQKDITDITQELYILSHYYCKEEKTRHVYKL